MNDVEFKITQAIEILTGITPVEIITSDMYLLTLGYKDPLRVGYELAKHPNETLEDLRFSGLVYMLKMIADMAADEQRWNHWLEHV